MTKKAFTLIEVLVSVVILSTVAVLLFEISTNSKNNFSFLSQKGNFTTLSSLPLMHSDQSFHNTEKELFDFVKYNYDIKDDDLRKYLKNQKIYYTHEEFTTFAPLGEDEIEVSEDEDKSIFNFTLVFDKIEIGNKEHSTYVYKIYMR